MTKLMVTKTADKVNLKMSLNFNVLGFCSYFSIHLKEVIYIVFLSRFEVCTF